MIKINLIDWLKASNACTVRPALAELLLWNWTWQVLVVSAAGNVLCRMTDDGNLLDDGSQSQAGLVKHRHVMNWWTFWPQLLLWLTICWLLLLTDRWLTWFMCELNTHTTDLLLRLVRVRVMLTTTAAVTHYLLVRVRVMLTTTAAVTHYLLVTVIDRSVTDLIHAWSKHSHNTLATETALILISSL